MTVQYVRSDPVDHHPTYLESRRAHWCECSCGWRSGNWRTPTGSQLDYGQHLVQANVRGDQ